MPYSIEIERLATGTFKWRVRIDAEHARHICDTLDDDVPAIMQKLRANFPHAHGSDCDAACAAQHFPEPAPAVRATYIDNASKNSTLAERIKAYLRQCDEPRTLSAIMEALVENDAYKVRNVLHAFIESSDVAREGTTGRTGYTYTWIGPECP